jgi:glycosyltransferase involved in cell wall biosynthesis
MQKKPKVGWLLKGNESLASSRIHGLNIHKYLVDRGWQSKIILQDATSILNIGIIGIIKLLFCSFDVLIFQQVAYGDSYALNRLNRFLGRKSCLSVCDLIDYDISKVVDSIIVPSVFLKEKLINNNSNISVIPDALEHDTILHKQDYFLSGKKIKLVWLGTKDAWALLDMVKDILTDSDYIDFELITISDHSDSTYRWSLPEINSIWDLIMNQDIAIIPSIDNDWYLSKSNNKLSTLMSLGMPVVAHPIPAYQKMKSNGAPVILARSRDEWCHAFSTLKSIKTRELLGRSARDYAVSEFKIEKIGALWEHFFADLLKHRK